MWGPEGLRFIVMCWYVPGRNVRAQKGTAGWDGQTVWGTLLPPQPQLPLPSIFCLQMGVNGHRYPRVPSPPTPRTQVAYAGLMCAGAGRKGLSSSVLLRALPPESDGATLKLKPSCTQMPFPIQLGTVCPSRVTTAIPSIRTLILVRRELGGWVGNIKVLLPIQGGSDQLPCMLIQGLGP